MTKWLYLASMGVEYVDDQALCTQRGRLRNGHGHGCIFADHLADRPTMKEFGRGRNSVLIPCVRQLPSTPQTRSDLPTSAEPRSSTEIQRGIQAPCITRASTLPQGLRRTPSMSNRRGIDLNLPRFDQLASTTPIATKMRAEASSHVMEESNLIELATTRNARQQLLRSHSLGPLTPPRDTEVLDWSNRPAVRSRTEAERDSTDQSAAGRSTPGPGKELSLSQTALPQLQPDFPMSSQGLQQASWLDRALRLISK